MIKSINSIWKRAFSNKAFRIASIYLSLSLFWIFFSDKFLFNFIRDAETQNIISLIKGWAFVIATSLILYKLIKQALSEVKKNEDSISESEQRYHTLANISPVGIFRTDANGLTTYVNPRWCEISGLSPQEAYGNGWLKAVHLEDIKKLSSNWKDATSKHNVSLAEYRFVHTDGTIVWVIGHAVPEKNLQNETVGYVGTITDITGRKKAEQEILNLNRVYAVISQINQAIVRIRDKEKLFEEVCRIAVEFGKFRMSWIGIVDEETKLVIPVTFAGVEDGYLSKVNTISASDVPEGRGPTGKAIREGKHFICVDIEKDSPVPKWQNEALKRGYHSSIALPIRLFGKPIGAFSLYASVPHFFDKEEVDLLDEVANDISFALDSIETENRRKQAEEELLESEYMLSEAQRIAHIGSWIYHLDGQISWSDEMYRIYGVAPEFTLNAESFIDLIHPLDRSKMQEWIISCSNGEKPSELEFRSIMPDGNVRFISGHGELKYDVNSKPLYMTGTAQDITEQKHAFEELQKSRQEYRALSAHLQKIREEERESIAREMHDELGQILTSLKMNIAFTRRELEESNSIEMKNKILKEFQSMNLTIDKAVSQVRKLITQLRPELLDKLGLIAALEWFSEEYQRTTKINCVFKSEHEELLLNHDIELAIFRIVQEAMTNAAKHSNAKSVQIRLSKNNNKLSIEINDDGKGILGTELAGTTSFGLMGMRERANLIGGDLDIFSTPEKGTTVRLVIVV